MCVYVPMYVCMYVCMYVGMYEQFTLFCVSINYVLALLE